MDLDDPSSWLFHGESRENCGRQGRKWQGSAYLPGVVRSWLLPSKFLKLTLSPMGWIILTTPPLSYAIPWWGQICLSSSPWLVSSSASRNLAIHLHFLSSEVPPCGALSKDLTPCRFLQQTQRKFLPPIHEQSAACPLDHSTSQVKVRHQSLVSLSCGEYLSVSSSDPTDNPSIGRRGTGPP